MLEFIKSNSTAVISTCGVLSGALIGGFFTITGNVLNYKANNSARKSQFDLEKWKANRSLFLERGEEAIELVSELADLYSSFTHAVTMEALGVEQNTNSGHINSGVSKQNITESFNRLDAIIVAYFPELSSEKDELAKIFQAALKNYFDDKFCNSSVDDPLTFMAEIVGSLVDISRDLKLKLSQEMKNYL